MLLVGSSGSAKCSEWLTDLCTKVDDRCLYVASPSEYTVSPILQYLLIRGYTSSILLPKIQKQLYRMKTLGALFRQWWSTVKFLKFSVERYVIKKSRFESFHQKWVVTRNDFYGIIRLYYYKLQ
ncbi:Hypothetical_protein [Hexamita inflata]|uniref:Hypothetical_protein n=1 Tax=Hexamita inflata TaxID=28002 RepID=A0AA86PAY1_9EUKA|nr:Hypothetical protein HINF_LOCUS20604 [Hexamita inflata]